MPPALSNAASIIARTSLVSLFGTPLGRPWPDVLLLGIRKSPHFTLSVTAAYFGTQVRRWKGHHPAATVEIAASNDLDRTGPWVFESERGGRRGTARRPSRARDRCRGAEYPGVNRRLAGRARSHRRAYAR